jgi:hypothetical protein
MAKNKTEIVILTPSNRALPALVAAAGAKASRRFVEFFTANIRNKREPADHKTLRPHD